MENTNEVGWAYEEFGRASLGDVRRRRRLLKVAEQASRYPSGRVTGVFRGSADREGAFRFVENDDVSSDEIARAAHLACAARAKDASYAFVPVDGTSLNLVDEQRVKGLGVVGSRYVGAQGLQVMSAIAVSAEGVPLGLCGQAYWARRERVARPSKHDRRRPEEKETQRWLDVMDQVRAAFVEAAPGTRPWFQLDRGGDAWPVLLDGLRPDQLFTVRAGRNRRLKSEGEEQREYLWSHLETTPILGAYNVEVPGTPNRKPRTARIEIRASRVTLDLQDLRSKRRFAAEMSAVLAREAGTTPAGENPIEWLLVTTYPVQSFIDAKTVVHGYTQRWRIEEFHKAWKTGACNVEETQLRDVDHIVRWATILASVAMRIVRMTYLARRQPDAPASVEFSAAEVLAIFHANHARPSTGQPPTIAKVVRLLADLGGYTGKSSGGPPGALVLARGLYRVQVLADFLHHQSAPYL